MVSPSSTPTGSDPGAKEQRGKPQTMNAGRCPNGQPCTPRSLGSGWQGEGGLTQAPGCRLAAPRSWVRGQACPCQPVGDYRPTPHPVVLPTTERLTHIHQKSLPHLCGSARHALLLWSKCTSSLAIRPTRSFSGVVIMPDSSLCHQLLTHVWQMLSPH